MASNHLRAIHPRRAGVADALARMVPLTNAREERRMLHRLELRERLK